MKREEILREAEKAVCWQREQDYGSPENNFNLIASFWSTYLGYPITNVDVAMMMTMLKIARVKNGGGTGDSFVDICGYGACGGELFSNNRENKATNLRMEVNYNENFS